MDKGHELALKEKKKHSGPRKRRPKKKKKEKRQNPRTMLSADATPYYPSLDSESSLQEDRAYWSKWAIEAAEKERNRRLSVLRQIQKEEDEERMARRNWALSVIEAEQRSMMRDMFLNSTANTQWFQEMISPLCRDYEVICTYSWFGCTHSCLLKDLDSHLERCPYRQLPDTIEEVMSEIPDLDSYDVVCPNSVLGCRETIARDLVSAHLAICPLSGKTREKETEERELWRQNVIQATEEERERRIAERNDILYEKVDGTVVVRPSLCLLQRVYEERMKMLQCILHKQIVQFVEDITRASNEKRNLEKTAIDQTKKIISSLWPNAIVEPFGSFVTRLNSISSDVDLVVWGIDTIDNSSRRTRETLNSRLHRFAEAMQTQDWVIEVCTIDHAAIPVVKILTKQGGSKIPLDVTFHHPELRHQGIASASLILKLVDSFHGLKELTLILKYFLTVRNMNDAYHGGLSSYGLVLMITRVLLLSPEQYIRYTSAPQDSDEVLEQLNKEILGQKHFGNQVGRDIVMCVPCLGSKTQMDCRLSEEPNLDQSENQPPHRYGKLLMDFLHYYADEFQPELEGISVLNGGKTILAQSSPHDGDALILEDPLDPRNNIGRNCYRVSQIIKNFAEFFGHLTSLAVRGGTTPELSCRPLDFIQHAQKPNYKPTSNSKITSKTPKSET